MKPTRGATAVAWLYIVAGTVGVSYHSSELLKQPTVEAEDIWILAVRVIAIVAGAFILRGAGWARWLAIAWMAYHVALSAGHSVSATAIHFLLLVVITYALWPRPPHARTRT